MKKHLLQMLCVFCLGVVTVPGVLGVVRWWRSSDFQTTRFVDFETVGREPDSNIVAAAGEQRLSVLSELDELDASVQSPSRTRQTEENPFADEALAESNPPAAARTAKPVRENLELDIEPPVLAQNSPIRTQFNPPSTNLDLEEEFHVEPVPVKQRTASINSKAEPPDGIESLADADLSDEQKAKLTTLREKLAELTKAKAELVNEQTLEETIFSLEKQISNLHAAQKLLSAQQILRALAEEFPDSPAAAKAQRMLEAARFKMTPTVSTDPLSGRPTVRYTVR